MPARGGSPHGAVAEGRVRPADGAVRRRRHALDAGSDQPGGHGRGKIQPRPAAPAAHEPVVTALKQVLEMEVPDPYTTFPMCEILKATRILSRELGNRVWICARADQGPMDLAAQLRGLNVYATMFKPITPEHIHKAITGALNLSVG